MSMKNILYFVGVIVSLSVPHMSLYATEVRLELEADRRFYTIKSDLPYHARTKTDKLHLIYENSYQVFDVEENSNDVAVVGPLSPCIGVVVTDGSKAIAFHKHSISSLASLEKIITQTLDMTNTDQLYARLYTLKDEKGWECEDRQIFHAGNTHQAEMMKTKEALKSIGFEETHIQDQMSSMPYSRDYLGQYYSLGRYVTVKMGDLFTSAGQSKTIKFSFITPSKEDIFDLTGTQVDIQGIQTLYEDLPSEYLARTRQKDGYTLHIKLYDQYVGKVTSRLYKENLGMTSEQLYGAITRIEDIPYDKYDFFPLEPVRKIFNCNTVSLYLNGEVNI